jgi:hypothetical protein
MEGLDALLGLPTASESGVHRLAIAVYRAIECREPCVELLAVLRVEVVAVPSCRSSSVRVSGEDDVAVGCRHSPPPSRDGP